MGDVVTQGMICVPGLRCSINIYTSHLDGVLNKGCLAVDYHTHPRHSGYGFGPGDTGNTNEYGHVSYVSQSGRPLLALDFERLGGMTSHEIYKKQEKLWRVVNP